MEQVVAYLDPVSQTMWVLSFRWLWVGSSLARNANHVALQALGCVVEFSSLRSSSFIMQVFSLTNNFVKWLYTHNLGPTSYYFVVLPLCCILIAVNLTLLGTVFFFSLLRQSSSESNMPHNRGKSKSYNFFFLVHCRNGHCLYSTSKFLTNLVLTQVADSRRNCLNLYVISKA